MHSRLSWAFAIGLSILNTKIAFGLPNLSGLDVIDLENDSIPLRKRQSESGVPVDPASQCSSPCNSVTSVLSSDAGCQATTCCKATFEQSYFSCFQCVAQAANITDLSGPQFLIDTLFNQCAVAGFALPKLTFAGQNSSRVLSTVVSGSATATAPTTASTGGVSSPGASSLSTLPLSVLSPSHSILTSAITGSPTSSNPFGQITIPNPTASGTNTGPVPFATPALGIRSMDIRWGMGVLGVAVGMILPQII